MTNTEFADFRQRYFRSVAACAKAWEMDRDTVTSLETGQTRRGTEYPVPLHIALACAGWAVGVREYDGGPVMIGG
jgi:hypothetical protein